MKINKKLIKELVESLEENSLTEIEYSEKDTTIKISRNIQNKNNNIDISQNTIKPKSEKKIEGIEIKSPIIGTAYLAPEPGGKNLLK